MLFAFNTISWRGLETGCSWLNCCNTKSKIRFLCFSKFPPFCEFRDVTAGVQGLSVSGPNSKVKPRRGNQGPAARCAVNPGKFEFLLLLVAVSPDDSQPASQVSRPDFRRSSRCYASAGKVTASASLPADFPSGASRSTLLRRRRGAVFDFRNKMRVSCH